MNARLLGIIRDDAPPVHPTHLNLWLYLN